MDCNYTSFREIFLYENYAHLQSEINGNNNFQNSTQGTNKRIFKRSTITNILHTKEGKHKIFHCARDMTTNYACAMKDNTNILK